jgi:hypothetical protein
MKKFLTLILAIGLPWIGLSQIVFNEIFNDGNAATTGTDALGTNWTATCPHCGATDDWLEIDMAGDSELEARDTNGPAYWETDDFSIAACTEGVTLSVDIRETGTQEPVSCNDVCNDGDGIKFEVSYDGGASWVAYSDAINGFTGTCNLFGECGTNDCQGCGACGSNPGCEAGNYPFPMAAGEFVTGPLIGTDDFTASTFTDCASVGVSPTIRLRLTFFCWSGSEYLFADNVRAECSNCALPVEIGRFEGKRLEDKAVINWRTLSESNNKRFDIQRSEDGIIYYTIGTTKGKMNSNATVDYEFIDENPINQKVSYYRLVQEDLNGNRKQSEVIAVKYEPTEIFYNGSEISVNFSAPGNKAYTTNIYDLSGKLIHTEQLSESSNISWSEKGFFILEIPELEIRQKLVIQ